MNKRSQVKSWLGLVALAIVVAIIYVLIKQYTAGADVLRPSTAWTGQAASALPPPISVVMPIGLIPLDEAPRTITCNDIKAGIKGLEANIKKVKSQLAYYRGLLAKDPNNQSYKNMIDALNSQLISLSQMLTVAKEYMSEECPIL